MCTWKCVGGRAERGEPRTESDGLSMRVKGRTYSCSNHEQEGRCNPLWKR